MFGVFVLGEKMSNPTFMGSNSDTRGATNSAPLTPLKFLKSFAGEFVELKAKGVFIDDLLNKRGQTIKSEYFIGNIEGRYKVVIDFGEVILKGYQHAIAVRILDWIEINGVKVRGE